MTAASESLINEIRRLSVKRLQKVTESSPPNSHLSLWSESSLNEISGRQRRQKRWRQWRTFSMRISRIAIFLINGSSSLSTNFFIATVWPVSRFLHLNTTPYEPSPIFSSFSYFSIVATAAAAAQWRRVIWLVMKLGAKALLVLIRTRATESTAAGTLDGRSSPRDNGWQWMWEAAPPARLQWLRFRNCNVNTLLACSGITAAL